MNTFREEERSCDGGRFLVRGRRNSQDDLAVAVTLAIEQAAQALTEHFESWVETTSVLKVEDRFFRSQRRIASFERQRSY